MTTQTPDAVREAVACPTCGDTSPLEECATCGAYPTRKAALDSRAGDAGEGLRMWQVKGPCETIMWETSCTEGQFADPVAALRCALTLPLSATPAPVGTDDRRLNPIDWNDPKLSEIAERYDASLSHGEGRK